MPLNRLPVRRPWTRRHPMVYVIRTIHSLLATIFITSILLLFYFALTDTFVIWTYFAAGALILEGIAVLLNRGNCPLTPWHRHFGDEKGFFNLILPDKWTPYASPVLAVIAAIGFVLLIIAALT